jgi:hypothetical protein
VRGRFQKVLLSWLLILAIGGHWPLLQSVAWMNMFVRFSQTDDLATAFVKTFDQKNACNLCKLVKKGQEAEQKQTAKISKLKLDPFFAEKDEFLIEARPSPIILARHLAPANLRSRPPSPPPKFP